MSDATKNITDEILREGIPDPAMIEDIPLSRALEALESGGVSLAIPPTVNTTAVAVTTANLTGVGVLSVLHKKPIKGPVKVQTGVPDGESVDFIENATSGPPPDLLDSLPGRDLIPVEFDKGFVPSIEISSKMLDPPIGGKILGGEAFEEAAPVAEAILGIVAEVATKAEIALIE